MSDYTICKSHIDFICLIAVISSCLYCNTVPSGFVWDDRAAIIGNTDVHGTQPISELFQHDFWGQDMTLHDSHKSYRPLTVLTYRLNHAYHGLSAMGYHMGNVVVYIFACISFYALCATWLKKSTAQLAVLLFCIHPVHVESVASIVGRADALCGLFYCFSACLYSYSFIHPAKSPNADEAAVGKVSERKPASSSLSTYFAPASMFLLSLVVAVMASLSKEIGITVFGVFIIIEVLHHFSNCDRNPNLSSNITGAGGSSNNNSSGSHGKKYPFKVFVSALVKCFSFVPSVLRIMVSVAVVALFLYKRVQLHTVDGDAGGDKQSMLYEWTILENHVHLLPTFKARALSYAQTHFWYIAKLIYPRYLCFDYGFLCIPTIHEFVDVRNLLPLSVYGSILSLAGYSLFTARINYILGLSLLLVPLIPAMNILFPVGTLLAERLLFIPSMGFCIIVAEWMLVDMHRVWLQLGLWVLSIATGRASTHVANANNLTTGSGISNPVQSSPRKANLTHKPGKSSTHGGGGGGNNATAGVNTNNTHNHKNHSSHQNKRVAFYFLFSVLIVPIMALSALRIITRNQEWQTEISVYGTALSICPNSIKALNNYGLLSMGQGDFSGALEKIERSIELYPGHAHAYLNAGVASSRLGDKIKAVHYYDSSIRIAKEVDKHRQSHAKAHGYKGMLLFDWSQERPYPQGAEKYLSHIDSDTNNKSGTFPSAAAVEVKEEMTPEIVDWVRTRLREVAEESLDYAIEFGFDPPSILHSRASLAIEKRDYDVAIWYLTHALSFAAEMRRNKDVPMQDMISEPMSYNQLALAYMSSGRNEEAVEAFKAGLQMSPDNCDLMANLGNLYRSMSMNVLSREIFQRCIDSRTQSVWTAGTSLGLPQYTSPLGPPPPAVFNNYGLLEMDNFQELSKARALFQEAVRIAESQHGTHAHGYDVMVGNLNKVTHVLNK